MSEGEIREAITLQEEHIKRISSCGGVIGVYHQWRGFENQETGKKYEACERCTVSASPNDYAIKQEEA